MPDKRVFETARETLKQLTARKLPPTPTNYQAVFNELADIPYVQPFPEEQLRQIVQGLPTKTPGQQKHKALLEFAISQRNWQGIQTAMLAYAGFIPTGALPAETPQERTASTISVPAFTSEFLQQIARMVEFSLPALGNDDARFQEQVDNLLVALRNPAPDLVAVKLELANFSHRLSFAAEDQVEIKKSLLSLLNLIIENIAGLSSDDSWLQGQAEALRQAAQPPLTLRRLDDLERRLKDVILKQTEAKGRAVEAQEELRRMLATFVERLSQMSETSSSYSGKMEESVRQIEQAKSIGEIAPVLKEVISATRSMAHESLSVRDELRNMREKTENTEAELAKLHRELDRVSAQARHDTLTGALNRQGLEEVLHRELSSMRRQETPLCVALLDIDNFKKINDDRGHAVGDAALTHLATVARECMRPQDSLARYGGEEFVIMLPDTTLEQGVEAMKRLQRELTRRFFLSDKEKILITFSAGVAQFAPDESGHEAIQRADRAMYLAKRAGKNRVMAA